MTCARFLLLVLACGSVGGCSFWVAVRLENETTEPVTVFLEATPANYLLEKEVVLSPESTFNAKLSTSQPPESLTLVATGDGWSVRRTFTSDRYPAALRDPSPMSANCHVHISKSGILLHGPTFIDKVAIWVEVLPGLIVIALPFVALAFLIRKVRRGASSHGTSAPQA